MRKSSKAFLNTGIFLAGIFLFGGQLFAQQSKTFNNLQLKYKVNYPGDYKLKPMGRLIVFVSPDVDKKSEFAGNINIAVEPLSAPIMKLDDFFSLSKKNLSLGGSLVKILDEKKDKLSGADAYRIVYTSKQKKTNFKLLQVIAIHKGKVFVITYTALAEQYDHGLAQANEMIKTLKFTD
jgi:hypothetical protein